MTVLWSAAHDRPLCKYQRQEDRPVAARYYPEGGQDA